MKKETIYNNWKKIMAGLEDLATENDEIAKSNIKLYTKLLKKLPNTVLVDDEFLSEGAVIQGVVNLYTDLEFSILPEKEKKSKTIVFTFFLDRVVIKRGWYNGKRIFSGDWIKALDFIMIQVLKTPLRKSLFEGQVIAAKELIKQLKIA